MFFEGSVSDVHWRSGRLYEDWMVCSWMVCGVKLYCCVSSSCNIQHKFFNILWYSFIQFFFIFYSSSVLCSDWCVVILEECTGYSHFPLLRSCVSQCDTLTQCWSGTANCSHSLADSPDRLPNIPHAQLAITFNLEHLAITYMKCNTLHGTESFLRS